MLRMGFAKKWVETIMQCVTTISYSVVMNGHLGEEFQPTRGLRQGDPLSSFLFLLCGEGLSSLLRIAEREGSLRGVKQKHFRRRKANGCQFTGCSKFNRARTLSRIAEYGEKEKEGSFQNLKDHLKKRIDNWCNRFLSQGESAHEDFQVWRGELTGEYLVHNAYKLLQIANLDSSYYLLQAEAKEFFSKLWKLQLPPKITIIIWHISWNYIPTLSNLRHRRLVTNARCPQCSDENEDCHHIFWQCSTRIEVWQLLNLSWITTFAHQDFWEWLTLIFNQGTNEQCRYFCYGLWILWHSRNQLLHERVHTTNRDLAQKIQDRVAEYKGIKVKMTSSHTRHNQRNGEDVSIMKIQFDAAFNNREFRSTSGLVVRGPMNEVLTTKSIIHRNVASPFAAEAFAGLEAIKLGIEMGFQEIQILGDSLIVIKKG
ncbi:hypothetical protein PVK06_023778 [Gossypium arboreum]|uniref:Reverse transcriptase n=1 Tax=Gossypium arboreum TaxID=29729 RepID=A0ABR0PCF4_GOSAR|nr:hypothetical protein PVK06_023778 [Gossypium arboreum]